jgi:hypothetical protein
MDTTSILIGWLLLSIVVGIWNYNRGNSYWIGFFISLIISPIFGAIVVAVTNPNKQKLEQKELEAGTLKKCPDCGELIKKEAKVCRFCNRKF